ncbi:MAG: flagellar basal body P-ring formation chaperone FlgA [Balneolaceae bacterium]
MALQFIIFLFFITSGSAGYVNPVEQRVISAASETLAGEYPDADFQIKVRWLPGRLEDASGPDIIHRVRFTQNTIPRGLTRAGVEIGSESYPVQFFIQTKLDLPVLNKAAEAGDLISDNMIILKKTDVTSFNRMPLLEIGEGPWVARRRLAAGQPVYANDIDLKPVLKRGDLVQMIYTATGLKIEFQCETRHPGAAGERITVRCDETGKRYEVTIIDEQTAEWRKTL